MDRTRLAIIGQFCTLMLVAAYPASGQPPRLPELFPSAPCGAPRRAAPLPTQAACGRGGWSCDRLIEASCGELRTAEGLDAQGLAVSVDSYYRATLHAARALQASGQRGADDQERLRQNYHRGLTGLILAGQRYGRLHPGKHLMIDGLHRQIIPIAYHGFAWRPCDFSRLTLAEESQSKELSRQIITCGLGLPLVAERIAACPDEKFFRDLQTFAVTAVLRPVAPGEVDDVSGGESVLELYNPHVTTRVDWCGRQQPLAHRFVGAALGGHPRNTAAVLARLHGTHRRGGEAQADHDRAVPAGQDSAGPDSWHVFRSDHVG